MYSCFRQKDHFFLTYFFEVSTNLFKRMDCNDLIVSDDAILHGFGAGRGNHTAPGTGLATRSPCSPQNTFYIVKAQSQNSFQILLEFQVCKFISLLPLNSHSLCLGF